MKNLQEATERICELKGGLAAVDTLTAALLRTLPAAQRALLKPVFERHAEVARSVLLNAPISELTIAAFEPDIARTTALLRDHATTAPAVDLPQPAGFSVLLYRKGLADWHQAEDTGGEIDVAARELDPSALPEGTVLHAFNPDHVQGLSTGIQVGQPVSIIGYPIGFHDTVHDLPVVRQAAIASA